VYRQDTVAYCADNKWAYETMKVAKGVALKPLQKDAVLESLYIY